MKERYDFICSAIKQRTLNEDIEQKIIPGIATTETMSISLEEFGEIEFRECAPSDEEWEEYRLTDLLDACDSFTVDFGNTYGARITFTVIPR